MLIVELSASFVYSQHSTSLFALDLIHHSFKPLTSQPFKLSASSSGKNHLFPSQSLAKAFKLPPSHLFVVTLLNSPTVPIAGINTCGSTNTLSMTFFDVLGSAIRSSRL